VAEPDIRFTHEVGKRKTAVLVLLGDSKSESQIAADQLRTRLLITTSHTTSERELLLTRQNGRLLQVTDIMVEYIFGWHVDAGRNFYGRRSVRRFWSHLARRPVIKGWQTTARLKQAVSEAIWPQNDAIFEERTQYKHFPAFP
jgi:hypothetical protein